MIVKPVILLIIPNLSPGGAQNVFRQQFDFLAARYSVYGCVFNWDGASADQWPSTIYSLNVPGGKNFFQKIRNFQKRIKALRTLKNRLNVTISISHLEGADYINILSKGQDKVILWIHGTKFFDKNISGVIGFVRKKILMPQLYKKADKIITVSMGIETELQTNFPTLRNRIATIYNGFDLTKIDVLASATPDPEFEALAKNYTVIITHCRLARQKNLQAFISLADLFKDNTDLKWVIIGDGEEQQNLRAQCHKLQIKTYEVWSGHPWSHDYQIYFLGYKSNPYTYLKRASLFLMTSDWEGFPLALCEAMACGLPAASADCPTGPREILKDGEEKFGELLPRHNNALLIQESYQLISNLLADKNRMKYYQSLGHKRISKFSFDRTEKELIELIESLQ